MPNQTLHHGYDAVGRLREQTDSLNPEQTKHLEPGPRRQPPAEQQQESWGEQVLRRWKDPSFNLLGKSGTPTQSTDPIIWPDNWIGFYDGHAWRYDGLGNQPG